MKAMPREIEGIVRGRPEILFRLNVCGPEPF
jgi:hypothetical protein